MKLFDFISVPYNEQTADYTTDCLWCGSSKFSVSKEEGHVYQCWACKEKGNALSFMRKWYSSLPEINMRSARMFIAKKRGITPVTLKQEGIKHDGLNFWFPVRNSKGDIIALHKYNPDNNITYASPKPWNCSILGLNSLTKNEEIWIAEGHADYLIMRQVMGKQAHTPDLLGTCGSGFSGSHLYVLENKHIVLLFDNDQAGMDGVNSVARRIKQSGHSVKSLKYLNWGDVTLSQHSTVPDKYDIRDWYNETAGVE